MYKAEYNEIIRCLRLVSKQQNQIFDMIRKIQITNGHPDKLMSIKDIKIYSWLSNSTIFRAINSDILKPIRSKGKKLFTQQSVNEWITIRSV